MIKLCCKRNHIKLLIFLCMFTEMYFIYEDFAIKQTFGILAFFLVLFLYIFQGHIEIRMNDTKLLFLLLSIIVTFFGLLPNANINKETLFCLILADLCMATVVLNDCDRAEIEIAFRLLSCFSFLLGIYTLIAKTFPSIYNTIITPLLTTRSREAYNLALKQGYGVMIGKSVPYTLTSLCIGLFVLICKLLSGDYDSKKKWKYSFGAGVILFAIIVENRKTELIAIITVMCFLYLSNVSAKSHAIYIKRLKKMPIIIVSIFVLGAFFLKLGLLDRYVGFFITIINNILNGGDILSGSPVRSAAIRLELWQRAFELFKSSPLIGIGWKNFSNHTLDTHDNFTGRSLQNVHNVFLQLLCETGILGFIAIMTPLVLIIIKTIRRAKRLAYAERDEMQFAKTANLVSLCIQIYYFVVFFLDPSFYEAFFWLFYSIAMILSAFSEEVERKCQEDNKNVINGFFLQLWTYCKKLIQKVK